MGKGHLVSVSINEDPGALSDLATMLSQDITRDFKGRAWSIANNLFYAGMIPHPWVCLRMSKDSQKCDDKGKIPQ